MQTEAEVRAAFKVPAQYDKGIWSQELRRWLFSFCDSIISIDPASGDAKESHMSCDDDGHYFAETAWSGP